MPERVLPDPLSGREIRLAIADQIVSQLARDGYLNVAHAYSHYTVKGSLHIELHDSGRVDVVDMEVKAEPVKTDDENALLDQFDAQLEVKEQAPNDVRVGTDQPVPVLAQDADGKPDIKHVKYSRKAVSKK